MVTRRGFLLGEAVSFVALTATCRGWAAKAFEVAGSDDEWRKLLSADQYAVLRQSGTEMPFTSPLLHEKRRGTFACAGCDLDLFSSTTKFESGTGWPSFWAPLENAVATETD